MCKNKYNNVSNKKIKKYIYTNKYMFVYCHNNFGSNPSWTIFNSTAPLGTPN